VESVRDDKKQPNSQQEFVLEEEIIDTTKKELKLLLFQTKLFLRITNSEMNM
jgi:hypothetical protein